MKSYLLVPFLLTQINEHIYLYLYILHIFFSGVKKFKLTRYHTNLRKSEVH